MTPSEYRYHIEKIYSEVSGKMDWLISDDQFNDFVLMAKTAGSGNLVLENWEIYLNGDGISDDFYEWWSEYRPDKLDGPIAPVIEEKKKSPFDAVRKELEKKVRVK